MKKFLPAVLIFLMLLSGCQAESAGKPKVVTEISVSSADSPEYHYTGERKVRKFLFYLRSLQRRIPAEDDIYDSSDQLFHVKLQYADGRESVCHHHTSGFLKIDSGSWQAVSPRSARRLNLLLHAMEPDEKVP